MRKIEDYAFIGDLQTAALISMEGSIDWCCFPRFDSGACFAALLGTPEHGRWLVGPNDGDAQTRRRYIPKTLVLETTHETDTGTVKVTDFMPPRGKSPDIVRIVEGISGTVTMRSELIVRFDYGSVVPWVQRVDHSRLIIAGPNALYLRTPVDIHGEEMTTVSEFNVSEGDSIPFVLTWFPSHEEFPSEFIPANALEDTISFWQDWSSGCQYQGEYFEAVHHSLMIMKALTYEPTGGIVAAPTTSLPEHIGGVRNWDYRYCWLRDATMTIVAMLSAGYRQEAISWRQWLLRAVAGSPVDIQIMYGIAGERRLEEYELNWLPGFEDSMPVRVGNAASNQMQLDVFGELMEASYLTLRHGSKPSKASWSILRHMLDWLEEGWRLPDSGIWEMRGPDRHFTHSKMMAWVAYDRAVRMCEEFGLDGKAGHWREIREEIKAQILDMAWNEEMQAYVQFYGAEQLDASVLLMPIVGFLSANDPRFESTVDAIQRQLSVDGLLLRYKECEDVDGLPAGEGVFLPCSFWLVEVFELQGRKEEARALFERLLTLANDLGLFAEEYDPREKRQLGNFPQAFTHLTLVEAAVTLSGDQVEHVQAPPVAPARTLSADERVSSKL